MALFSGSSQRRLAMWQIGEAQKERERNDALIAEARGQALNEIGSGVDQAAPYYTGAIERFTPWATTGLNAYNTLAGSYGINGQAGNDSAVAAFRASPGYQWNVDQSTDAVARKQSAMGMLGSGNTMTAIQDRAHNLADQEYGKWQSGLNTLAGIGYNATGQQANLERGIGDLYAGAGAQRGNVWMQGAGLNVGSNNNYLNSISQSAQTAGRAGQDALASNLNFGINALGTVLGGASSLKKAGFF